MITDEAILERHDVDCRPRCRMELKIVNKLLELASVAGYTIRIYEYEGEETPDPKDALFGVDVANVKLYKNNKYVGWILLVFGNSGHDLISDYSVKLEEFLKPALELSDRLENGLE